MNDSPQMKLGSDKHESRKTTKEEGEEIVRGRERRKKKTKLELQRSTWK